MTKPELLAEVEAIHAQLRAIMNDAAFLTGGTDTETYRDLRNALWNITSATSRLNKEIHATKEKL